MVSAGRIDAMLSSQLHDLCRAPFEFKMDWLHYRALTRDAQEGALCSSGTHTAICADLSA